MPIFGSLAPMPTMPQAKSALDNAGGLLTDSASYFSLPSQPGFKDIPGSADQEGNYRDILLHWARRDPGMLQWLIQRGSPILSDSQA